MSPAKFRHGTVDRRFALGSGVLKEKPHVLVDLVNSRSKT